MLYETSITTQMPLKYELPIKNVRMQPVAEQPAGTTTGWVSATQIACKKTFRFSAHSLFGNAASAGARRSVKRWRKPLFE